MKFTVVVALAFLGIATAAPNAAPVDFSEETAQLLETRGCKCYTQCGYGGPNSCYRVCTGC